MKKATDIDFVKRTLAWCIILDGKYAGKLVGCVGRTNFLTLTLEMKDGDLRTIRKEKNTSKLGLSEELSDIDLFNCLQNIIRLNKFEPRFTTLRGASVEREMNKWGYEMHRIL